MMRRRPTVLLLLLVVPVLLASSAMPARANVPVGRSHPITASVDEATAAVTRAAARPRLNRVLVLVNRARSQARTCGSTRYPAVGPVRRHDKLDRAARRFARLMAHRNFFDHASPDGSDPGDRISREGYRWTGYGENIAAGYQTPRDVVRGWMQSEGHCVNIMSRLPEIGVGWGYDADSDYGTYWVLDLASR